MDRLEVVKERWIGRKMNFVNVERKDAEFQEQADRVHLDLLPAVVARLCGIRGYWTMVTDEIRKATVSVVPLWASDALSFPEEALIYVVYERVKKFYLQPIHA